MSSPPKDRNFLAQVQTTGFINGRFVDTGTKWAECRWYDGAFYGSPCYIIWSGNEKTLSTNAKVNIIQWTELPTNGEFV